MILTITTCKDGNTDFYVYFHSEFFRMNGKKEQSLLKQSSEETRA